MITKAPRRVGHKGSSHIAPGNTLQAFDAALQAGVDMIEFDVLSERPDGSGELLIAHDYEAIESKQLLTLDEALQHLASPDFADMELDVDVKLPGYTKRVVKALQDAGLEDRSLLTATYASELDLARSIAPHLKVGWSVPRARRDYTASALTALPAFVLLQGIRAWLPRKAGSALRSRRFDAIMAHWRLINHALVRAVKDAGGDLYVWTVDDAKMIEKLTSMGVDGIITNDPRLFA